MAVFRDDILEVIMSCKPETETEEDYKARIHYDTIVGALTMSEDLRVRGHKIQAGELPASNKDAASEKLITTSRAMEIHISETVFANIVLPYVEKQPETDRARIIQELIANHSSLKEVSGLLPKEGTVSYSEEEIIQIMEDISNGTIKFEEIQKFANAVIKRDVDGEDLPEDSVEEIRTLDSTLTSLVVEKRMKEVAKKLVELRMKTPQTEETAREISDLKETIKTEFGYLSNYEEIFGRIVDEVDIEDLDPMVVAAYEAVRQAERDAETAFNTEVEPTITMVQNKDKRFLVNTSTGEVIDNRTRDRKERIRNYAYATGEREAQFTETDKKTMEFFMNAYMPKLLPDLNTPLGQARYKKLEEELKPRNGDNWYEIYKQNVISAYVSSYKSTTQRLEQPEIVEGLTERSNGEDRVKPVSFEELSFVISTFERRLDETGNEILVVKETGEKVTSGKTISSFAYAEAWAKAYGKQVGEDGSVTIRTSVAFSPEKERLFNAVQTAVNGVLASGPVENAEDLDTAAIMEALPEDMRTAEATELLTRTGDAVIAFHGVQTTAPVREAAETAEEESRTR